MREEGERGWRKRKRNRGRKAERERERERERGGWRQEGDRCSKRGIEGKGDCKKVIEKEREWGREGKIKKDRRRW